MAEGTPWWGTKSTNFAIGEFQFSAADMETVSWRIRREMITDTVSGQIVPLNRHAVWFVGVIRSASVARHIARSVHPIHHTVTYTGPSMHQHVHYGNPNPEGFYGWSKIPGKCLHQPAPFGNHWTRCFRSDSRLFLKNHDQSMEPEVSSYVFTQKYTRCQTC